MTWTKNINRLVLPKFTHFYWSISVSFHDCSKAKGNKTVGVWLAVISLWIACPSTSTPWEAVRSESLPQEWLKELWFAKRTLKVGTWDLNRVEQDSFSDIWWLLTLPRLLSVTMIQYDLYAAILVDFRFSNKWMFSLWCYRIFEPNINLVQIWFWHASSIFFSCTFSQQLCPLLSACQQIGLALHLCRDKWQKSEVWTVETSSNACCSCLVQAHAGLNFPVSQRQGSDDFKSSFSLLTFKKATICGSDVSQSHEDLKGVSYKLCCVMAYKIASRSHHVRGNSINALN